MVIRVFVSGISGNKEVKKRQQRVTMILESKNIDYTVIDIAEPGNETEKEFMQENSKPRDSKHALPPQIFNGDHYCGDYEDFDMANELDELEKFLDLTQDYGNNKILENGLKNGPKEDSDSENMMKEDIRESAQKTIDTVSRTELEAVSLGNEIESSEPGEILKTLDDVSKDLRNPSENLFESPVKDSVSNSTNDDAVDEISENEISKVPVEPESLNEENSESDAKSEDDSVDTSSDEN